MAKMTEVGEDLLEKIMSTLPPKALMRFKCASKEWYALINNPRFVAKHLSSYNSNSKHLLVMKRLIVPKDTTNNPEQEEENDKEEEELAFSLFNLCNNDSTDNGEDRIIVSSVEDIKIPLYMSRTIKGEAFHMVGHVNGIICLLLVISFQVVLWNPAIQEFKLLSPFPYLPSYDSGSQDVSYSRFVQGFGYDAKLNEYKVVNIGLGFASDLRDDDYDVHTRPKAAIYSLSTGSWTKINTNALETETTVFRPESFEIQFKQMLCWIGHEQNKEVLILDRDDDLIRQVIILLDIQNEVFHNIMLPDSYHPSHMLRTYMALRVWNGSLALFVSDDDFEGYELDYFVIWVLDERGGPKCAWKKHIILEPNQKPLAFLNSNGIFLNDFKGLVLSHDLGCERLDDILFQNTPYSTNGYYYNANDMAAVVYVNSIASVLGVDKLKSRDNGSVANFSPLTDFLSIPSIADLEWNSYSIWAFPTVDVSLRIKKVMEGLRTEFGGPDIEPHIPVVGPIRMTTDEDVLDKFRSLCSKRLFAYQAKASLVVTTSFYHQCVSLLIDISSKAYSELDYTSCISSGHFGYLQVRPYLSLLYGNLTEEERKNALEKVCILDEGIASLSFTFDRLALHKIKYKDTTLKSWAKIAEYTLPLP